MAQVFYCLCSVGIRAIGILLISLFSTFTMSAIRSERLHYQAQNWKLQEITVYQLTQQSKDIIIVDARSAVEFSDFHLPGAVSLPADSWDEMIPAFLERWSPELKIIVYCESSGCGLSKSVALRLIRELPEASAFILKGGVRDWKRSRGQSL